MTAEYFVELIQLPVSETFSAQPALFAELRAGAKKGGVTSQAYGQALEDSSKLYWVVHFESGVVPRTLKWPEEEYGDFIEQVGHIATAPPKSLFAPLKGPFPKSTTNAPVTEVATITLKPGADKAAYTKCMDAFINDCALKAEGVHGAVWSFATEDPDWRLEKADTVLAFVGWDSVEAHTKLAQTDEFKTRAAGLKPFIAASSMVHIKATHA